MYMGFLTALIVTQVALDVKYDDPNQGKLSILSIPSSNDEFASYNDFIFI